MLSNDEHEKILQYLERQMAGSANVPPGSSFQPCLPDRQAPGSRSSRLPDRQAGSGQARILDLTDVPDLLALPAEPVAWLVEGLIPRAAVTLVAGEPGSYKSWLALRLARSVSEGAAFLGRACPRLPVLYLDRENPLAVVRERLEVLEVGSERLDVGGEGREAGTSWPQPAVSNLQLPPSNLRIWGGWLRDEPPQIGDAPFADRASLEAADDFRLADPLSRRRRKLGHGNGSGDGRTARAGTCRSDRGGVAPPRQERSLALPRLE